MELILSKLKFMLQILNLLSVKSHSKKIIKSCKLLGLLSSPDVSHVKVLHSNEGRNGIKRPCLAGANRAAFPYAGAPPTVDIGLIASY